MVPEKNETEIFCDADARRRKTTDVASAKAGRRHKNYKAATYPIVEEDKKIPNTENVSSDQNDNFIIMCEKDNNFRV